MAMKDWSFKTGQNNGPMVQYSQIQILLYNRLMKSQVYKHIVEKLDLTDFLLAEYEVCVVKSRSNKRYLEFIWYDLCGEEVLLKVLVDKNTEQEFQSLQLDLLLVNRKATNKVHSDPYYRAPKDPNFSSYARI